MDASKNKLSNGGEGHDLKVQASTVEDLENQFYAGYPEWRLDGYRAQTHILKTLFGSKHAEFEAAPNKEKINLIVNLLFSNSEDQTNIEQLALFTQIRSILS